MKPVFIAISCIISLASCSAQSRMAKGEVVNAPDSALLIVFQDSKNNYWFGSDGQGIYKYDGRALLHFTVQDGLPNGRVRQIEEDKAGNIYINTLGGISRFDGNGFFTLPVDTTLKEWKLSADDLWFSGNQDENGPYRYDGKKLYQLKFPKHYMHDAFYARLPDAPYNPYQVYKTYKDSKGNIWLGTSTFGICRYDGKKLSWIYEDHLTHIGTEGSFGIRSILEDKSGKFWFCNTRYRFDIHDKDSAQGFVGYSRETGIEDLKSPDGRDRIYFMSVVEGDDGVLWMATYGLGAWRYDGKTMKQYAIKDGNKDVLLYSVYKDNKGAIWLGTHNGGAYKFNGAAFEKFGVYR